MRVSIEGCVVRCVRGTNLFVVFMGQQVGSVVGVSSLAKVIMRCQRCCFHGIIYPPKHRYNIILLMVIVMMKISATKLTIRGKDWQHVTLLSPAR